MFRVLAFLCLGSLCFGSLEEKVGQLLMVHFHGDVANEEARVLIQETKVGGIIYYNWANGLSSPEQIRTLSEALQGLVIGNTPLLIAADQEGGVVARSNQGFTKFPGNRALGEVGDFSLAEAAAFAMGEELLAVGINMNLAPVVDVNSNPRNPVIGVRSFGDDPKRVAELGKSALKGYKRSHVVATLKHFPGHGDTEVDSHQELPILHKSKEELERVELLPFARLAPLADAIMTAHIVVPAFDGENCSTISEKTLSYLRETLGFKGVIVSDSLVMEGVLKKCRTVEEAAISALSAGCDLLILGGRLIVGEQAGYELTVADVKRIHKAIVDAVKSGRLSEARVNEAAGRIFDLKKRLKGSRRALSEAVNTQTHHAIAKEIASLALKTSKLPERLSLDEKRGVVFAPQLLREAIEETSLLKMGKETDSYFFKGLSPTIGEIEAAKEHAAEADVLFVCSYNAWENPSQITFIQSLIDCGKPVVLLVMRDPLDASLFTGAHLIFKTFSPTACSIQAVCDALGNQ